MSALASTATEACANKLGDSRIVSSPLASLKDKFLLTKLFSLLRIWLCMPITAVSE